MDEGGGIGMIQSTSLMVGFCHRLQSAQPHHHLHCRYSRWSSSVCSQSQMSTIRSKFSHYTSFYSKSAVILFKCKPSFHVFRATFFLWSFQLRFHPVVWKGLTTSLPNESLIHTGTMWGFSFVQRIFEYLTDLITLHGFDDTKLHIHLFQWLNVIKK